MTFVFYIQTDCGCCFYQPCSFYFPQDYLKKYKHFLNGLKVWEQTKKMFLPKNLNELKRKQ